MNSPIILMAGGLGTRSNTKDNPRSLQSISLIDNFLSYYLKVIPNEKKIYIAMGPWANEILFWIENNQAKIIPVETKNLKPIPAFQKAIVQAQCSSAWYLDANTFLIPSIFKSLFEKCNTDQSFFSFGSEVIAPTHLEYKKLETWKGFIPSLYDLRGTGFYHFSSDLLKNILASSLTDDIDKIIEQVSSSCFIPIVLEDDSWGVYHYTNDLDRIKTLYSRC